MPTKLCVHVRETRGGQRAFTVFPRTRVIKAKGFDRKGLNKPLRIFRHNSHCRVCPLLPSNRAGLLRTH